MGKKASELRPEPRLARGRRRRWPPLSGRTRPCAEWWRPRPARARQSGVVPRDGTARPRQGERFLLVRRGMEEVREEMEAIIAPAVGAGGMQQWYTAVCAAARWRMPHLAPCLALLSSPTPGTSRLASRILVLQSHSLQSTRELLPRQRVTRELRLRTTHGAQPHKRGPKRLA